MATKILTTVFTASAENVMIHPNADRLELVTILGWQVVCAKGSTIHGKKYVYVQPGSVVPAELADKWGVRQYLRGSNHDRVEQVLLRGEPSFGFIALADDQTWEDGLNVADYYGITKYDPPIKMMCGDRMADHPLFVKYTDIENLRNYPNVFCEGETVIATEKIHGTNSRIGLIEGEKMAGSMSIRRKPMPEHYEHSAERNTYWYPWTLKCVNELMNHLSQEHKVVILFGEVYGTQIQKGYHYDSEKGKVGYRVFDIFVDGKYMNINDTLLLCAKFGVPVVPILYRGPFSLGAIRRCASGQTTIGDGNIREGVVVHPIEERTDKKVGRVALKFISDEYLLSKHPDSKDV